MWKMRHVRAAYKMANGQMLCLLSTNMCVQLDATGKEIKRFGMPMGFVASILTYGNIDITPKGHIVVVQNVNTVVEYDSDGKVVWQAAVMNGSRATRLANGNTLVASMNGNVVELDNAGKTVWQYQPPAGYQAIRVRLEGDANAAVGLGAFHRHQANKPIWALTLVLRGSLQNPFMPDIFERWRLTGCSQAPVRPADGRCVSTHEQSLLDRNEADPLVGGRFPAVAHEVPDFEAAESRPFRDESGNPFSRKTPKRFPGCLGGRCQSAMKCSPGTWAKSM